MTSEEQPRRRRRRRSPAAENFSKGTDSRENQREELPAMSGAKTPILGPADIENKGEGFSTL
ncbi:MAG: hypothetical protein HOK57_11665, partial [Planctomycetaceae bacterium]|nr:hypothetical protein [Planctomycetaceae bacterium]